MQLIEVAVVAAFRNANVSLKRIRQAREYVKREFGSEYPFAQYRFKTDGKSLLLALEQVDGPKGKNKLIEVNRNGQLAWDEIIGSRLQEFAATTISGRSSGPWCAISTGW
ncbi:hypothetical protein NPA31_005240 [Aurantimonas sp. MSK8Z-1]|uniref:hypothetical protein n=1 Tax=Mangrovibrevibacter kandeliae TaxID=2968473 RepID=UPI0021187041|nr:hypothetical protein [Aurantimonas sp. MSK8Z-1]MCW4114366.1 hypothetical protein [Aurantimonas sp. MSK8Z-1]